MNTSFFIAPHTVHIWHISLSFFSHDITTLLPFLTKEEEERANRFRLYMHRNRFIITRSLLRKTLHLYLNIPAAHILFNYGPHGKPSLASTDQSLQFNISHSHEVAVFALTVQQDIGIDIEKIEKQPHDNIAKRYFSPAEYKRLISLPEKERTFYFYTLWTRKEAVIKALGEGIFHLLPHISISSNQKNEIIHFTQQSKSHLFHIQDIFIEKEYATAIATAEPIDQIIYWKWTHEGPEKLILS